MPISKLVENLNRFNYNRLLDECFVESEQELLAYLRSQLLSGQSGDGEMPLYKSKAYARKKGKDNVDLKLTGAFYSKMKVYHNKYSVRIRSTDPKNKKLMLRYGTKIFELNPENYFDFVIKIILPLLQKKLRHELLSTNE